MRSAFNRQTEASAYAASIPNPVERVWVEFFLSCAIGTLVRDPEYAAKAESNPIDMLILARVAQSAFTDPSLIRTILSGKYSHFADIPGQF